MAFVIDPVNCVLNLTHNLVFVLGVEVFGLLFVTLKVIVSELVAVGLKVASEFLGLENELIIFLHLDLILYKLLPVIWGQSI